MYTAIVGKGLICQMHTDLCLLQARFCVEFAMANTRKEVHGLGVMGPVKHGITFCVLVLYKVSLYLKEIGTVQHASNIFV